MAPANASSIFILVQGESAKKDLIKRFDELTDEFRRESVNGSIQLHFNQGYLSKIHSTKVD